MTITTQRPLTEHFKPGSTTRLSSRQALGCADLRSDATEVKDYLGSDAEVGSGVSGVTVAEQPNLLDPPTT